MLISVQQKHITNGKRGMCNECPIAKAMRDSGFSFPRVLNEAVEVWGLPNDLHGRGEFSLPRSAQRFIQAFDKRKPVKPFRFKLEIG